jgi:hypothetical protein
MTFVVAIIKFEERKLGKISSRFCASIKSEIAGQKLDANFTLILRIDLRPVSSSLFSAGR